LFRGMIKPSSRHRPLAYSSPEAVQTTGTIALTEAEKRLWQILRARQTDGYRFRRQVPIGRFIADFVCMRRD
jgi:hypothetical protein